MNRIKVTGLSWELRDSVGNLLAYGEASDARQLGQLVAAILKGFQS